MKLDCPHCGDSFPYDPGAGGSVYNCRHCKLPVRLPRVDQLPPDKLRELQAERQAVVRKEQRQAEHAQKKAAKQQRREEQRLEESAAKARAAEENARRIAVATAPPSPPVPVPGLSGCPDCGHSVSMHATACPGCGRPMTVPQQQASQVMPQQQAAKVTTNVIVQSRPSQALPALANFFIIGLGQLIQGRLWMAFCFFVLSVVSGLLCFVGIGFVLLPIVWLWAILDAAKYVPRAP